MSMLPVSRPMAPAKSPRNEMVRRVAEQLMTGGATPAYGTAGIIANAAKPFLGHMMAGAMDRRESEERERAATERRAETSAMGRMLEKARAARAGGGDVYSVIDEEMAKYGHLPGMENARRGLMERELSGLLSGPGERKTAKDAAGRLRYLDTGELAFPEAEMPTEPRETREVKVGGNVVTQEFDPSTGRWEEIATSPRRAGVEVNLPKQVTEVEKTEEAINRNRQKYEETGDEKYARMADRLEMKLTFGGKPPESYVKARNSINQAREGIGKTYELIARGQANPLSPSDRAEVRQSVNSARLAYADLLNRGANFTETEQAMIDAMLGGDPNDVVMRALRGDQSYLDRLRDAGEALERRGAGLLESFTTPGVGTYEYPWRRQEGMVAPQASTQPTAPPAQGTTEATTLPGTREGMESLSDEEVLRRLGVQ